MKQRAGMPKLEALESEEEDKNTANDYFLSESGQTVHFPGITGMYVVNREALRVEGTLDPNELLNQRCQLSDLDMSKNRLLGFGASGKVYAVKHIPSGVYLALKRISMGSEEQLQQIRRELNALYRESNEYLISFYGAFFDHGNILIALELMDGSLQDAILSMGRVPENVCIAITKQVVAGLHYLHKTRHLVHRDIKPSNLLFSREGFIKITDFGISAALQSTLCMANSFVGTVIYMSPERLSGADYSFAADIWSLGISLIQMATGCHPFSKLSKVTFWDVLRCLNQETPQLPNNGEFQDEFRSLLDLCLHKEATKRATTVELLSNPLLESMSDQDSVLACLSFFPEVRKQIRANEKSRREKQKITLENTEKILMDAAK
eukprot:NODE_3578_length_1326_cov_8.165420_g3127_i0.p1 GENE.NODE_3578_length_1326_cov_8.165420_g3127_i0~~NODE_3578_length_1326_cov_8.165420_g3127_i0.p1  ORF type:complete len:379 (+),score=58.60 NODE_3578_length_1326_cov_8.165420_g3127_i0:78-1214(+)